MGCRSGRVGRLERRRAWPCDWAETVETLIEKLKVVIPELLDANGLLASGVNEVPFALRAERTEQPRPAA